MISLRRKPGPLGIWSPRRSNCTECCTCSCTRGRGCGLRVLKNAAAGLRGSARRAITNVGRVAGTHQSRRHRGCFQNCHGSLSAITSPVGSCFVLTVTHQRRFLRALQCLRCWSVTAATRFAGNPDEPAAKFTIEPTGSVAVR